MTYGGSFSVRIIIVERPQIQVRILIMGKDSDSSSNDAVSGVFGVVLEGDFVWQRLAGGEARCFRRCPNALKAATE